MARTFETGQILAGKYRVDRPLGKGAMGVVFAATTLANGLPVAIKILLSEQIHPAERARFVQEATIAIRLRGEHSVRVLEIGALEDGVPYIVMELLAGEDLSHLLEREGPQSPERAVAWLLDACKALAEAHAAGIVHRDLKPANMFLAKPPHGEPIIKILDFGLSKLADDIPGRPRLTATLSVFGSPAYMAPEQLVDTGKVDRRADIYSLGVTLFELLSCKLPFIARSPAELAALVMRDPPRSLRAARPDVPPGLELVVMRCLEKNPRDRYQTASELAAALTATLVDPREAPKTIQMQHGPTVSPSDLAELAPTRLFVKKKKTAISGWTIAAACALLALVTATGVLLYVIVRR
jgi:serine/threonine-protein kinase